MTIFLWKEKLFPLLILDGKDGNTSSQQVTKVVSGKILKFVKIQMYQSSQKSI